MVGVGVAGFETAGLAEPDYCWAVAWGAGEGGIGEVVVGTSGWS
jgi:hypothetical protein